MTRYERFYEGEWSGLYIDGVLDRYGDHYLVDERIASLLGVEDYYDDAWLVDDRTPRRSVKEIESEQERRIAKDTQAAEKKERADELMAQARALLEGIDE